MAVSSQRTGISHLGRNSQQFAVSSHKLTKCNGNPHFRKQKSFNVLTSKKINPYRKLQVAEYCSKYLLYKYQIDYLHLLIPSRKINMN